MRIFEESDPKLTTQIVRCCPLILLALLGCSDGRVALPKAPVTGKVTYREKPLSTGRVIFVHQSGQAVAADLDADGRFNADVYQGMNQVAIASYEPDPPNVNPQTLFIRKSLVPNRYANGSSSGLSCEVKPDETNRAEFRLTD